METELRKCLIAGCDKSILLKRKQLCNAHRIRLWRYGNPDTLKTTKGEDRRKHPLYATYCNMKARCYSKSSTSYPRYGAKGVRICDRWLGIDGFKNFIIDMGNRPEGHTLDRINNRGHYSPKNCRWANLVQQANNKSDNIILEVNGRKDTLANFAREYGMNRGTVYSRLLAGYDHLSALTKPLGKNHGRG